MAAPLTSPLMSSPHTSFQIFHFIEKLIAASVPKKSPFDPSFPHDRMCSPFGPPVDWLQQKPKILDASPLSHFFLISNMYNLPNNFPSGKTLLLLDQDFVALFR